MRVIANAGGNLPEAILREYRIGAAPMRITVDGIDHDTSELIGYEQLEAWIRTAKTYPQPQGGGAAELLDLLRTHAAEDPELLLVTASRHIMGSYTATSSAARVLSSRARSGTIEVVDSGFVDVGIGLVALLAAQAARAGLPLAEVATLARRFAQAAMLGVVPDTLEYLVKAGRATSLKAFIADVLSLRPIIGILDGEMKVIENVQRSEEGVRTGLLAYAERRVGRGRPVWIGIQHASAPDRAAQLEVQVRREFDVRVSLVRPFHASVYLAVGPGAVGLFMAPIDELPWTPG